MSEDLTAVQAEFPAFRIWREELCGRVRFVARSMRPDVNPHTVITPDLSELRAAIEPSWEASARPFSPATPNVARMYDYLLHDQDHLAADRAAAGILRRFPEVAVIARANREFQAEPRGCYLQFSPMSRIAVPRVNGILEVDRIEFQALGIL